MEAPGLDPSSPILGHGALAAVHLLTESPTPPEPVATITDGPPIAVKVVSKALLVALQQVDAIFEKRERLEAVALKSSSPFVVTFMRAARRRYCLPIYACCLGPAPQVWICGLCLMHILCHCPVGCHGAAWHAVFRAHCSTYILIELRTATSSLAIFVWMRLANRLSSILDVHGNLSSLPVAPSASLAHFLTWRPKCWRGAATHARRTGGRLASCSSSVSQAALQAAIYSLKATTTTRPKPMIRPCSVRTLWRRLDAASGRIPRLRMLTPAANSRRGGCYSKKVAAILPPDADDKSTSSLARFVLASLQHEPMPRAAAAVDWAAQNQPPKPPTRVTQEPFDTNDEHGYASLRSIVRAPSQGVAR